MLSYNKISGTAETIAYIRSQGVKLSPNDWYAKEIARLCDAEEATKRFYHRPDFAIDLERMKKLFPWAYLRLEAIRAAVRKSGVRNVFELGAGYSYAGIATVTEEPYDMETYLETDLPFVIHRKENIMAEICRDDGWASSRLAFAPVNALDGPQMLEAAKEHFKKGPVAIVHEGLFQYLEHEEKFQVARNIAAVLKEYGGVWITTDVVRKHDFKKAFEKSAYMRRVHEIMAENTGRDMLDYAFTSYNEAYNLFATAGFSVEHESQMEVARKALVWLHRDHHENIHRGDLPKQQIWAMRLK